MERSFDYEASKFGTDAVRDIYRERTGKHLDKVQDGLILGSGLGDFVQESFAEKAVEIPFDDVFKRVYRANSDAGERKNGGVPGHAKKLVIGKLKDGGDRVIFAQSGREHPYEGIDTKRATFWLRIMQQLGVETLIGSNASGILTPKTLKPTDLMLINGDLDLADDNPLVGPNDDRWGPRFPHMGDLYPNKSRKLAKEIASGVGVKLEEGIYIRVKGPNYERVEDVYRLRGLVNGIYRQASSQNGEEKITGAQVAVVGMSSTYEQIVAQHATQSERYPAFRKGRVFISVATNYAGTLGDKGLVPPPTHAEVQENADKVRPQFGKLVRELLKNMHRD